MVAIVSIAAWSFVCTYIIAFCINLIPGFKFRSPEEQELYGDDWGEMGELVHHHVEPPEKVATNVDKAWSGGAQAVTKAEVSTVPGPRLRKTVTMRWTKKGAKEQGRGTNSRSSHEEEAAEMKDLEL